LLFHCLNIASLHTGADKKYSSLDNYSDHEYRTQEQGIHEGAALVEQIDHNYFL
jgi:hypothetical protein